MEGRGRWVFEFEASLDYRVSSRTALATQRTMSQKNKKICFIPNCVCRCMGMCVQAMVPSEPQESMELESQAALTPSSRRVLGFEPRTSARALCSQNQQVISALLWAKFGSYLGKRGQGWQEGSGDREACYVAW